MRFSTTSLCYRREYKVLKSGINKSPALDQNITMTEAETAREEKREVLRDQETRQSHHLKETVINVRNRSTMQENAEEAGGSRIQLRAKKSVSLM